METISSLRQVRDGVGVLLALTERHFAQHEQATRTLLVVQLWMAVVCRLTHTAAQKRHTQGTNKAQTSTDHL